MDYPKYNAAARAEVFALLESIEKTFDGFGDKDAAKAADGAINKSWLEGRSSGYKLVADHLRRTKAMYGEKS